MGNNYVVSNISQTDDKTKLDYHSVRGPGISTSLYRYNEEVKFRNFGTIENGLMIHASVLNELLNIAYTEGYKLKSKQLNDLLAQVTP